MDELLYIGCYDCNENKIENRKVALSAVNKMNYIAKSLRDIGYRVKIVSSAITMNKKRYEARSVNLEHNIELQLLPTLPCGSVCARVLQRLTMRIQIARFLYKNTNENSKVIVYHSCGYMRIIELLKKIKKFKLILEVEEIYADVSGNERMRKSELHFFNQADAFIFPTELLNQQINKKGKPYVLIHGTYQVEAARECKFFNSKIHSDKQSQIHVVYAGTFDSRKGGAIAAAAAEHLPSNYHIHIIGFGTVEETEKMKNLISKIADKNKAMVTYDGCLSGEEYIRFIQGCDIGLSTQNPDAAFNMTSFPSKILSYLANGLRVVSIRISAIEDSAIGKELFYYENQTPLEVAEAIKRASAEKKNSRAVIKELDEKFKDEIGKILSIV
ncbi:glycosyltransferase [Heliophilum fasciatum]|uniref:Glycosyl transferase family 1 n=1 Tax=Heliophilum fasciatum TaxID=35700 RepID=A0A4R2RLY2_9FIRM|nr:glycosyltransferase [Heliophilum fasciatum]MCW2278081.1 hypothetical protein [Heliophilum fasciatum]TCP64153.1 glycosyl transferase family 1 [Heliophilum fasciatum]